MAPASRLHGAAVAARHQLAIGRIRLAARLAGVALDLDVARTARLGRVDVRFTSSAPARLAIGDNSVLDGGVELRIDGGTVQIGEWCEVRGGVRIMAAGVLDVEGQNVLSWGMVVHCDERITLGRQSTYGEYVTVSDSAHQHVAGGWHVDQLHTSPVSVGRDTWVGAKATITRGVTVGAHCVVAAGAVVTKDVPDHHAALGIPATSRPLPPPTDPAGG